MIGWAVVLALACSWVVVLATIVRVLEDQQELRASVRLQAMKRPPPTKAQLMEWGQCAMGFPPPPEKNPAWDGRRWGVCNPGAADILPQEGCECWGCRERRRTLAYRARCVREAWRALLHSMLGALLYWTREARVQRAEAEAEAAMQAALSIQVTVGRP